jgi:hypothetical protein
MDIVKIPQNVYVEDRIIGSITLRQIIMVCVGGAMTYGLWALLQTAYGVVGIPAYALSSIPLIISIAFAFIKVNDVTLWRMCTLLISRIGRPNIQLWSPRKGNSIVMHTNKILDDVEDDSQKKKAPKSKKDIQNLSTMLDNPPPEVTEETSEVESTPVQEAIKQKTQEPTKEPQDAAPKTTANILSDLSKHS